MTRKDILIAAALKRQQPAEHWDANKRCQFGLDVNSIADALASDNPRFDRERFLKACGVN